MNVISRLTNIIRFKEPRVLYLALCFLTTSFARLTAAEPELKINTPVPYQVIQRVGYVPGTAYEHNPGGPTLGYADVAISLTLSGAGIDRIEARLKDQIPPNDGRLPLPGEEWQKVEGNIQGDTFTGKLRVPAGGWYRLELRGMSADQPVALSNIEPFGVGEVFLIAGQSYAERANDERLTVQEPQGRVTLLDRATNTWRIAHDPEETPDRGTIWPPFGDYLVPILRVPVGFCNVAVGGTSSRQWLPGTDLYNGLIQGGSALGSFRAILWQQGESDVIERVTREQYVQNLKLIRESSAAVWKFEPPWLMAKSTLHPTVYNRPVEEGAIRSAIEDLWKMPGFGVGPDTDTLGGENRGGPMTRQHFTGLGQRRAALMWFVAAINEIERQATAEAPEIAK